MHRKRGLAEPWAGRTIFWMPRSRDRRLAIGLAVGVSLLTLIPYLVARQLAPSGWTFSGFLVNPYDGFSYFAKMRQGLDGNWLFVLPYAADPGRPSLLFLFYLALGHFSRISGLSLSGTFHAARVLGGTLMFWTSYLLLERLPLTRAARWCGYALILGVSGLGWLGLGAGITASDLLIPESVPWIAVLVNPHFSVAAAALALGFLAVLTAGSRWEVSALAAAAGLLLGIVQPFLLATLWSVLGAWTGLEWVLGRQARAGQRAGSSALTVLLASAVTGLPWVLYDAWLIATHPALRQWSLQNLTPSPSPLAYLIGFGPLIFWGALGLVRARPLAQPQIRLIALWAALGLLLLYLPIGLQRRLSLGLAIPLAALAGIGIDHVGRTAGRTRLAVAGTLLLTLPSMLIVAGAGVASSASPGSPTLLSQNELEAYRWISTHLTEGDTVLAAEQTGNRIPAYTDLRVLLGHPFETPQATAEREWIAQSFAWSGDPVAGLHRLQERGVDYIYFGREEAALGDPTWLAGMTPRFTSDEVRVYGVAP